MKSTFARVSALLLALVLAFTVCGCKPSTDDEEGGLVADLGGYEFTVVDFDGNRWNKEKSGTPYLDSWIEIMDKVESDYNCTIKATYMGKLDMFTTIQPELAAGGKYADLIIAAQYEYGRFLGADLMMDLNELDVNWDNEWWNQDIRQMGTYGGKSYVGLGSFMFDTVCTWLLYYNEAVWDEMGFEDPYKLVDERRWTFDVFREYCKQVSEDRDNSGAMDSYEDRWGIVAANGDFCRAWFQSLGGEYYKTDENGRVKLACNNQKTYDIYDSMYQMVKNDKSIYPTATWGMEAEAERITAFSSGNALFYAYMPGIDGLKEMEDDWGVIPLPLYNSEQEDYMSGVDHNAGVFGVTKNNEDIYEVSLILEALGKEAMILQDIFWPDYKETYWRHEEDDTRMVSDYVVGHGKHDLAILMQNVNSVFKMPMDRIYQGVFGTAGPDLSSYMDMYTDPIEVKLEDYFKYDVDAETQVTE